MEFIKLNYGINTIDVINNKESQSPYYCKSFYAIYHNSKYYTFDLYVDKNFLDDLRIQLNIKIYKKDCFLIYNNNNSFKILMVTKSISELIFLNLKIKTN